MKLRIADIPTDRRIQLRDRRRPERETVAEWSEAMVAGDRFPPVVVFFDGEFYWLADGNHRVAAAERNSFAEIDAEVLEGGKAEATLYAAAANRQHGIRRTNADKRKAVEAVLKIKPRWSDRRIADHVGVGNQLVGDVRRDLCESHTSPSEREGKDGKSYPVPSKANGPASKPAPSANGSAAPPAPSLGPENNPKPQAADKLPELAVVASAADQESHATDDDGDWEDDWDPVIALCEYVRSLIDRWPEDRYLAELASALRGEANRIDRLVEHQRKAQ